MAPFKKTIRNNESALSYFWNAHKELGQILSMENVYECIGAGGGHEL